MNRWYSHYRLDTGEILAFSEKCLEPPTPAEGFGILEGTYDHLSQRVDLDTGEVVDWQPDKPAGDDYTDHEWDEGAKRWLPVLTLAGERRALVTRLRTARDARINGGFVWDGSRFDSDAEVSQPRLLGLFTTALAGGIPPEGYPWRLADNGWRVLSAADAIAVWGAFQQHMAGLFAAFAAHEAAVLAETDIEVLRNYDTEAGWP